MSKHEDLKRWLAFGLIALAVLIFYFPSLYYPPRADQVIYLAQMAEKHHPMDLIFGSYDYNRTRTIAPGDQLLFRPLLFDFLGLEQVLFGHHFWAWQLVELLAHLTLLWVLLRLLWHLSGPWLAFAGTWLFALSVFNYEMVTWSHMSCYIFAMAGVIAVFEQVVYCFEDKQVPWSRIHRMLIYSLIACFMYETSNVFILLMAGMLMVSFPRIMGRLMILIAPVVLYLLTSFYNYTCVNHITAHSVGETQGIAVIKYVSAVVYLSFWWLYEGMFNGLYHYVLAIRTMYVPSEVMVFKKLVLKNPQVLMQLIILTAFFVLAWIGRHQFYNRIRLLFILGGMLFCYGMIIVVGRYQGTGLFDAVRVNTYYSYMFWAIMVIMAFLFLKAPGTKTRVQHWLVIIFFTASLFSGLWQGKKIYDMTVQYSSETNCIVLLVTTLDLLIREKGSEPNFSFYVDPYYPGNYPYGTIRRISDPPGKEYSFAEFLYPQYFRPKPAAKYKFLAK